MYGTLDKRLGMLGIVCVEKRDALEFTQSRERKNDVISWFNDLFDELQCYKIKTSFNLWFRHN